VFKGGKEGGGLREKDEGGAKNNDTIMETTKGILGANYIRGSVR